MSATLPRPIVTCLDELGQALAAYVETHRDAPLATLEQGVLDAVRAVLPKLLGAVVQETTRALDPAQPRVREACPECGTRREPRHQWRPRTVRTVCGPLHFERPQYRCRPCQQTWSPADRTLELAPRVRLSAGLDRWLAEVGAFTAFTPGARLLEDLTGQRVSDETVRQHSERRGALVEAAQQAASQQVVRTRDAAGPVDPAPGLMLLEADGVMVRYRQTGWHEVKVGLVAGWVDGTFVAPSYVAAREPAEAFGPRLRTEAARRGALAIVGWAGGRTGHGLAVLRRVVILGDGAHWIWELAAEHFGERIEILDFYHATEHLGTLAHALYGSGTAEATAWVAARRHTLRHDGGTALWADLQGLRAPTAEAREILRRERAYFRTNEARMAYPTFVAQGLPIGSGAVEAAAKHLVQQRMKRPGARWSPAGGQAILALCAHRASQPDRAPRYATYRREAAAAKRHAAPGASALALA